MHNKCSLASVRISDWVICGSFILHAASIFIPNYTLLQINYVIDLDTNQ